MTKLVDISDIDPNGYFPIKMGLVPPSSIKMDKFGNLPANEQKIFQIDKGHRTFLQNKWDARQEGLGKYYQNTGDVNIAPVIRFICAKLSEDWPEYFTYQERVLEGEAVLKCRLSDEVLTFDTERNWSLKSSKQRYQDAFDALSMQVPEDIVVCTVPDEGPDFVSYIHLMAPSGWSAEWAVGKTFWEIHEKVLKADGRPVIKNSEKIVKGILRMPTSFQRVGAITFRSDPVLNRHPEKDVEDVWTFDEEQRLLLRFERQTITSFPEINSFLFTVRTYYNDLTKPERIGNTIKALENAHPDAYGRKFLKSYKRQALEFLEHKMALMDFNDE